LRQHTTNFQKQNYQPLQPKKTPEKKFGKILGWGIVGLLLVGCLLLFFNEQIRDWTIANRSQHFALKHVTSNDILKNKKKKGNYDFSQVQPIDSKTILLEHPNYSGVIGAIAIPDVQLNLPIFEGVGGDNLFYGAGTMKEDQIMGSGNYALAGHHIFDSLYGDNSSMLFSPLQNAKQGMLIYLTDKSTVYSYRITSVTTVGGDEGEIIYDKGEKSLLTLITCTDAEATARIAVQGELVKKEAWEKVPLLQNVFNQPYNKDYDLQNTVFN
jgi:sortase A